MAYDVDAVVARAKSALRKKTIYKLGGGLPPLSIGVWPEGWTADCSAFVAWCVGMKRRVKHPLYEAQNGGWFETTAIWRDIGTSVGFFDERATAVPGCVVVYPDKNGKEGHIGIVTEASGKGVAGVKKIIHCSSSSYRNHGDAILETDAKFFHNRKDSKIGYVVTET